MAIASEQKLPFAEEHTQWNCFVSDMAPRWPTAEEVQDRGELTSSQERGTNYLQRTVYNKHLVSYMACVTLSD